MPPIKRFQKEDIINTAYEIVKKEGLKSVNARRIAKELGGSVQLIYHNFKTMNELNKAVYDKIFSKYQEVIVNEEDKEHPYLAKGIAYIKFAKEYPEFFKIIFMQENKMSIDEFLEFDSITTENVLNTINKKFDIPKEYLKGFHIKVWIFTHGLACIVATKTVDIKDEEIKELLQNTVQEMFKGYSLRRKK